MNAQFWRDVRTLLANRQPALAYLAAIGAIGVGIDLLTARVVDELPSFSSFARHEFAVDVGWRSFAALGDASALAWVVVLLSVPATSVAAGWLTACYLTALADGRYALRAPRRTIARLALLWLLNDLLTLGLAGLSRDVSDGLAVLVSIAILPPLLFAEYAIVVDDVSMVEGLRRSLRLFAVRRRAAIGALVGLLFANQILGLLFYEGFTDKTHVQPAYLLAWVLANGVLFGFASDVVLLTLYRQTPLSAGGSAGSSAAPPTSTPSD